MTTFILICIGLVVVGLLIQVLGKAAGDSGAQALGGMLSGCGKLGCGCVFWLAVAAVGVVILLIFSLGRPPQ